MDKIYARAFRERKSGWETKQEHGWGCLALGRAGSSDANKRKGPNPREYPEPQLKLELKTSLRCRLLYFVWGERVSRRPLVVVGVSVWIE